MDSRPPLAGELWRCVRRVGRVGVVSRQSLVMDVFARGLSDTIHVRYRYVADGKNGSSRGSDTITLPEFLERFEFESRSALPGLEPWCRVALTEAA